MDNICLARRNAVYSIKNIVFVLLLIFLSSITSSTLNAKTKVLLEVDRPFEEQIINQADVIYIFKDVISQKNSVINLPNNSVLLFKGGKLLNANLVLGENVTISDGIIEISEDGCILLNNNCRITNCAFLSVSHCRVGYGVLFAQSCQNIIIKDCFFNSQKRQTKGKCSSIDFRKCEDFVIDGVISNYTEGDNIIIYDGRGVVKNCQCNEGWSGVSTVNYGASLENPKQGDSEAKVIIKNNKIKNSIAAGISINNSNTVCKRNTVLFENCLVGGPGIRLGHYFSPSSNCTIYKNQIRWISSKPNGESTSNRGISIDAGNNNRILANKIIGVPEGISSSVCNKTGTIIKNNTIDGANEVGITVFESQELDNTCQIIDNFINMQSGIGIWVRNCNSTIRGNTIRFPHAKSVTATDDEYTCLGLLIEDHSLIETIVDHNIVSDSNCPIKANIRGKSLLLENNRINNKKKCVIVVGKDTYFRQRN